MDAHHKPAETANLTTRLLIVDDEPGICLMLKEWLTQTGFACQTALSGGEALEILREREVDAVISDLSMPGVSGLDLLVQVRKTYPHTAFLMATGVGDIRLGIQAMKQGADDYLMKPFQLDAVEASVARALEMRRLERELEDYRKRLEEMVDVRTRQLQAALGHISEIYDETLEALGAALDLKDGDTAGHARRVSRYCLEIANAMGCSEEEKHQLTRGAYLHDIGKIAIPDAILLKPAKLTPQEMSVMWAHPYIGYEFVARISFLAEAAEIVLTHHERYDGSGYPQGLIGDEIPLGARVFAVADTLDAMTSDRPYRHALPHSAAREEILRQSGRQFESRVVDAFFSIPEQVWEKIRLEVADSHLSQRVVKLEKLQPSAKQMSSAGTGLDPARRVRHMN
ncbi:MAG: HD domain-containing phosphohydrolase [Terriglobia bacterium]